MEARIKPENIMMLLDSIYETTKDGVPIISKPIEELAEEYLKKYRDKEVAAKKLIDSQIAKCSVSGFLTGVGGAITLPVAVSADISVVLYVQMRMIAGVAYIAGYELNDDEVQTLVYACLAGVSVQNILTKAGVDIGEKFAVSMIKKIPGDVLTKINQKVGFRLLTKFGQKGAVNLGDLVPGVGGLISGGFDFAETKIIAKRAYKQFVLGEFSDEDESIDVAFEMDDEGFFNQVDTYLKEKEPL